MMILRKTVLHYHIMDVFDIWIVPGIPFGWTNPLDHFVNGYVIGLVDDT